MILSEKNVWIIRNSSFVHTKCFLLSWLWNLQTNSSVTSKKLVLPCIILIYVLIGLFCKITKCMFFPSFSFSFWTKVISTSDLSSVTFVFVASKPNRWLTGSSVWFQAVVIVYSNRTRSEPDGNTGQPAVGFWSCPLNGGKVNLQICDYIIFFKDYAKVVLLNVLGK